MVKVCAIYPRKSKANDNSDSMETQIQMCSDYLNEHFPGCIIEIYDKDYGITGHSVKKRKDFQRMMERVRSGNINVVAIQRYDRIARNTRDFCNLFYDMEQAGCELVSVSQRIDTSTPYGKKFMYDLASTAELEWALNSERHKDTNKYARLNRKCALSPYALPFGYKAEIRNGKRVAVIDKEVEHIVRDAIDYYKRTESKQQTTRYINSKYGLNKSHSFMTTLCKSDFYHGAYREVPDYCEAYMTLEEHEKLRKISKKYVRHYNSDKNYFLFSGLITCPVCGAKMESQSQINTSGNRYYYYRCYNVYRTGKCTFNKNINEKSLESYLLAHIQDHIGSINDNSQYFYEEKKNVVNLAKYKAEMERLTNAYLKGRIKEDFYDSEYERLQRIIHEQESQRPIEKKYNSAQLKEVFNAEWQEAYLQLNREKKRQFWKTFIQKIALKEDKSVDAIYFL